MYRLSKTNQILELRELATCNNALEPTVGGTLVYEFILVRNILGCRQFTEIFVPFNLSASSNEIILRQVFVIVYPLAPASLPKSSRSNVGGLEICFYIKNQYIIISVLLLYLLRAILNLRVF